MGSEKGRSKGKRRKMSVLMEMWGRLGTVGSAVSISGVQLPLLLAEGLQVWDSSF